MPTGANLPGWAYSFKQRYSMEYTRLRTMFYNLYTSCHYKWFIRKKGARKEKGKIILNYPFRRGKITAVAEEMHQKMYTAFAAGDEERLKSMCSEGILASFRNRMSRRQPNEELEWHCQRLGRPKLVSHRATLLPYKSPDGGNAAFRQAIVRLRTYQTLRRSTLGSVARERPKSAFQQNLENARTAKDGGAALRQHQAARKADDTVESGSEVTEYFVIQRRLWKGEEEPWQVWGMAEETTVAKLHELQDEIKLMQGAKSDRAMGNLKRLSGAQT